MTLAPSGRATVTGDGSTAAVDAILTTRLTAAGVPDPSFGTAGDGRVVIPGASAEDDTTCGAATRAGVLVGGRMESLFDVALPAEVRELPGDLAALDVPQTKHPPSKPLDPPNHSICRAKRQVHHFRGQVRLHGGWTPRS
jgi:hypothetical protein